MAALNLAIVGSRSLASNLAARAAITTVLRVLKPDLVISGGARGIDQIAAEAAIRENIPVKEFLPSVRDWAAPGGYRDRDIQIAEACNMLVAVIDEASWTRGAAWTANYCADNVHVRVVRMYVGRDRQLHGMNASELARLAEDARAGI